MATLLYLGTDDGVKTLRSEDGKSWELRSGKMPDVSVEEVAIPADRPNVVLAGTRGDGVWASEDYGATFVKPSYGKRGPGKVRCLTFDPVNSERVYAGCEPIDVYVSDDLGKNWSVMDSVWEHPWVPTVGYPVATTEPHVRDIAVDPHDPNTIYLALQVGSILKTTDGGETWELLEGGVDCDVHTFAINPEDSNTIFAATGGGESRTGRDGKALYSSSDGGHTWTPLAMNLDQEYSIPIVAKPGQPEVMYAGLANGNPGAWRSRDSGAEGVLARTKDGGLTWEAADLSGIEGGSKAFTAAITTDASDPERVYAVLNNGELITSADSGTSWTSLGVNQRGTNDIKCVSV